MADNENSSSDKTTTLYSPWGTKVTVAAGEDTDNLKEQGFSTTKPKS